MVVRRTIGRRQGPLSPVSAAVFLIAMAMPPVDASARSVGGATAGPPSSTFARVQSEGYDPAAAHFYSLLSFGAMRLIAPAIFGDFQSPVVQSYAPQWSGIMQEGADFDTAVSTMLNGIVQQDLLPTGGALMAAEFGIGASANSAAEDPAAPALSNSPNLNVSVPTAVGEPGDPAAEAGGIAPICEEDEVADRLQAGGEYWSHQEAGVVGAGLAPVQFPLGVLARSISFAGLQGGLGPTGNRTNLAAPGPAGGWCRPGRELFSLTSPLEDSLLWIAFSVVLGALLVVWLSRGARLPAI